jgi:hypothetical protein
VGIIRLKIDHRILLGGGVKNRGGIKVIRAIKEKVNNLFENDKLYDEFVKDSDVKSDYFVVESWEARHTGG